VAYLVPELGAALADLEMVLQGTAVQGAAAKRGQLLPDLRAARVPCLGAMGKRRPRLIDESLHLRRCASDRLGDLGLVQSPQLKQQQGHALILRQAPQIAEQLAQLVAALDLLGESLSGGLERVCRALASGAKRRQAAIASDRVEPRAGMGRRGPRVSLLVGGQKRLLCRVLGVLLTAEHVTAERQNARLVAVVEDLEGLVMAVADRGNKPLIFEL
jgi:hypothetical protein